jgi:hypothetical protein
VDRLWPAARFGERLEYETRIAEVSGVFTTAPGGMYLDFGWAGSMAAILACGLATGWFYVSGVKRRELGFQLLLAFALVGILLSPVFSLFGSHISLLSVGAALVCSALLIWWQRGQRAADLPAAQAVPPAAPTEGREYEPAIG